MYFDESFCCEKSLKSKGIFCTESVISMLVAAAFIAICGWSDTAPANQNKNIHVAAVHFYSGNHHSFIDHTFLAPVLQWNW